MPLKYNNNIRRINDSENKIRLAISKSTIKLIIGYVLRDNPDRSGLNNIRRLFYMIDLDMYKKDLKVYNALLFIKTVLHARIVKQLTNLEAIKSYCLSFNNETFKAIIDKIDLFLNIHAKDVEYIDDYIIQNLKFGYILKYKDNIMRDLESIDVNDSSAMQETVDKLRGDITRMLAEMRSTQITSVSNSFTLQEGLFQAAITDIVNKVKDKSRQYKTGLKALNNILSPAFLSGRLYLFLARTGNFKSGLLLSIASWFKRYGDDIKPRRNPDAIPTVLLITTENSVAETLERLYAMSVPNGELSVLNPENAIKEFRSLGFEITEENPVNLRIEYRNDREIDTNDIYGIIEDIETNGEEVVALLVDYIKRIRASEPGYGDERIELKNCSSELKNLAENLDIPVITAMQINRAGNNMVEEAISKEKDDVGKFLNSGNVANCWDLIENSDWVCIINIEKHRVTENYYLSFKLAKIRYADKSSGLTYFCQPFADGDKIRLMEDYNLEKSLALKSLTVIEESKPKKKKKDDIDFKSFLLGHDGGV